MRNNSAGVPALSDNLSSLSTITTFICLSVYILYIEFCRFKTKTNSSPTLCIFDELKVIFDFKSAFLFLLGSFVRFLQKFWFAFLFCFIKRKLFYRTWHLLTLTPNSFLLKICILFTKKIIRIFFRYSLSDFVSTKAFRDAMLAFNSAIVLAKSADVIMFQLWI